MSRLSQIFTCGVVLACLCWASAAPGKVIYVDDDATGANNGSSWVSAFRYLQDALAAAAAPDEIRVAQGVYRPDRGANVAVGDRKASFYLVSGTALYGGYAGIPAADPNERDVERYQTILSGDLAGNDADVDDLAKLSTVPTRAENSSRVVQCMSVEPTTLLDGCIITGGMRAGLDNVYGRPSISHCVFHGNAGVNGSAVVNLQGHITLTGCRLLSNFASGTGGALYSNATSSVVLVECVFEGNRAYGAGGAVRCHGVSLTLTRCVFSRNLSQKEGGAVSCDGNADVEITGCTFSANEARGHADRSYPRTGGGAVYIADRDVWSDVSVTDCLFEHNRTGETGGAVCSLAPIRLGHNRFTNNVAQRGGGVFVDAGTFIEHCLFAGNQASASGGAVHNLGLNNVLTHCTFAGNVAPGGRAVACHPLFYPGTGALVPLSQVDLSNCIVWDGPGEFAYWLDSGSEITMAYSDIPGGWEGPGNMDVNPCFADPGRWDPNGTPDDPNDDIWIDGDYHLKSQAGRWDPVGEDWILDEVTSPCIDAGDPNSPVGDEPEPNGGRINMGANGGTAEASKSWREELQ
jgi:predicted outer membrane repeat protein